MQLNTNSKPTPDCEQRLVRVLPRLDAVHRVPDAGEVCISITNPRQSPASLEEGWAEVLRLGFHDTDRRGGGFTEMTFEQAMDVLAFCRRHAAAPLTVHCQFGQSRSVAVGIFLAAWLGRPVQLTHDVLAPNPWALRQLRRAALLCALRWRDGRLLMVALSSPLAPRFRYGMMPKAIADTYQP